MKSPQAARDKGRWPRGGPRTRGPAPGMPRRPGGAYATRSVRSTLGRAEGRGREDIALFPRLARARSRQQKHAKSTQNASGARGLRRCPAKLAPRPSPRLGACSSLAAAATPSQHTQLLEVVIPDLPVQGSPTPSASALRHLSFCTVMPAGILQDPRPSCLCYLKRYVRANHPEGEYLKIC